MYVCWSECGLGFGSDADNFEIQKHKYACVWPHWWFCGSEMGLHTGLGVGIVGWILVGFPPLCFVFSTSKVTPRGVLRGVGGVRECPRTCPQFCSGLLAAGSCAGTLMGCVCVCACGNNPGARFGRRLCISNSKK